MQIEPVARPHRDLHLGVSELDRANGFARSVGRHDRHRQRQHEPVRAQHGDDQEQATPHVAPAVLLPRPPGEADGNGSESQPGRKQEKTAPVVALGPDVRSVDKCRRGADDGERSEHERDASPKPRSQSTVGRDGDREKTQRHHGRDDVIVGGRSRLGRDERVDHDVRGDDHHRQPEHEELGPPRGSGMAAHRRPAARVTRWRQASSLVVRLEWVSRNVQPEMIAATPHSMLISVVRSHNNAFRVKRCETPH